MSDVRDGYFSVFQFLIITLIIITFKYNLLSNHMYQNVVLKKIEQKKKNYFLKSTSTNATIEK